MFYKEKIGKNKSCTPELRKLVVRKYAERNATMASVAADLGFLEKCFLMLLKVITAIGHAIICIKRKRPVKSRKSRKGQLVEQVNTILFCPKPKLINPYQPN